MKTRLKWQLVTIILEWNSYLVQTTVLTFMKVCVILGLELLIAPQFSQLTHFPPCFIWIEKPLLAPQQFYITVISFLEMFNFGDEEKKQNTCETRTLKDQTQEKDILR